MPLQDAEGYLQLEETRILKDMVSRAPLSLPTAEELRKDGAKVEDAGGNSFGGWHTYYREKRERLLSFLNRAIELGEPIRVSL